MSNLISGSIGTGASGVYVNLRSISGVATPVHLNGVSDSSGNYSFSGLSAGLYRLTADTRTLTGTYAGYIYRHPVEVLLDGTNDATNVNLVPYSASAAN